MANIKNSKEWAEHVRQIEVGDRVVGGPDAPINICLSHLVGRTGYLKDKIEAVPSTTTPGMVKTSSAVDSDREDTVATSKAVKAAYDKADGTAPKNHTHTAAEITDFKNAVIDLFQPQQHSETGYQHFPNRFALQWGNVNGRWEGERPQKITFPVAFTACYGVFIISRSEGSTQNIVLIDSTWGVQNLSNASFEAVWNTWSTGNASHLRGFNWFAIGVI